MQKMSVVLNFYLSSSKNQSKREVGKASRMATGGSRAISIYFGKQMATG